MSALDRLTPYLRGAHGLWFPQMALRAGSDGDALALIHIVSTEGLGAPEVADYPFVFSYIALAANDPTRLRQADRRLRAALRPIAYFQTQRFQHIITVRDALTALAERRDPPKISGFLRALSAVSRYAQLQSNFNGFGVNFNNIIDDAVERAARKARDEDGQ